MGLSYNIEKLAEMESLDNVNPNDPNAPKVNNDEFRGGYFSILPGAEPRFEFGLMQLPLDVMAFGRGRFKGLLRIPGFVRVEPTDAHPLEEMWPVGWKELHLRGRQGYLPRILPKVGNVGHGFWWDEKDPELLMRGFGRVVEVWDVSFNVVSAGNHDKSDG